MIWAGRRDHLEVDMTPLMGMPSSLVRYIRVLLVCLYNQSPAKHLLLKIREYNMQNSMSAQRNLTEAIKVWSLIQF